MPSTFEKSRQNDRFLLSSWPEEQATLQGRDFHLKTAHGLFISFTKLLFPSDREARILAKTFLGRLPCMCKEWGTKSEKSDIEFVHINDIFVYPTECPAWVHCVENHLLSWHPAVSKPVLLLQFRWWFGTVLPSGEGISWVDWTPTSQITFQAQAVR